MEKATFIAIAEIFEVPNEEEGKSLNPFLTMAKFIFADDKANANNQGIEVEDFEAVADTAIHMPIKMKFNGTGVENHLGSYVVGHIIEMEKAVAENGSNQLVATAVLYADEYPEEVQFLKDAYASGEAPGISYEISYKDSIIKNGVQWLKNLVTCAATFVRSPAYGKRTALLALASAKTDSEFNETLKSLVAQAEETYIEPIPSDKGGNNVDELEQAKAEVERIKAEAETKTAEIARLMDQLTEKDSEIATLQGTIESLERDRTIEARTRKFTEAGFALEADAEKADKKRAFWLSLSDEAFEEYLSDLVSAKAMAAKKEDNKTAFASLRNTEVPKLEVPEMTGALPSFKFRD